MRSCHIFLQNISILKQLNRPPNPLLHQNDIWHTTLRTRVPLAFSNIAISALRLYFITCIVALIPSTCLSTNMVKLV